MSLISRGIELIFSQLEFETTKFSIVLTIPQLNYLDWFDVLLQKQICYFTIVVVFKSVSEGLSVADPYLVVFSSFNYINYLNLI